MSTQQEHVDVLIIGGGPAGLTAAAQLARRITGRVLVLEREAGAGGIPRHSDHLGYGIRDRHRILRGPAYAQLLVQDAVAAGAEIRTGTMVTGWASPNSVQVTSATGCHTINARVTVLATGARERSRSARMIPGDRPEGVFSTGQLQNMVHLHHAHVGSTAVVVGAELVSWSAVLTLREASVKTVLMTTTYQAPESYAAFNMVGRMALRVPVATGTKLVAIHGRGRLEAVEIENLRSGVRRLVPCDTVVLTGDWIPDHELARAAGIALDPGTLGPRVDANFRTSIPGIFAIGNMVHPVDTADVAALDGRDVASAVIQHLNGALPPPGGVRIIVAPPLKWISPSWATPGDSAPARGRYLLWTKELVNFPRVWVRQGSALLSSRIVPWPASPGRVFRLPADLLAGVDYHGPTVTVGLGPR